MFNLRLSAAGIILLAAFSFNVSAQQKPIGIFNGQTDIGTLTKAAVCSFQFGAERMDYPR
jgi:hypothetical protein